MTKPTICVKCVHHHEGLNNPWMAGFPAWCSAGEAGMDFVTGEPILPVSVCRVKNDGSCVDYKAK